MREAVRKGKKREEGCERAGEGRRGPGKTKKEEEEEEKSTVVVEAADRQTERRTARP